MTFAEALRVSETGRVKCLGFAGMQNEYWIVLAIKGGYVGLEDLNRRHWIPNTQEEMEESSVVKRKSMESTISILWARKYLRMIGII